MPSRPTATTGTSAHPSDLSNTLVLETSVAEWVKIIKEVLSRSPDSIISQWETLAMDDPSPKWELQFWTEHLQNLEFLQSQLSQEHVLSCIEALSSMHHPSANHMQTLKAEVEAGRLFWHPFLVSFQSTCRLTESFCIFFFSQ